MSGKKGKEIGIIAGILLVDQLTKFLANKYLALNQPVAVIKGFFYFTLVHNRGAAFGILKNQLPIFIITALAAIILISINLKNKQHKQPAVYNLSLSLILAGGLGNLIDRIFFGHVIDFFDFRIWPVFNIADSAITIGAILLGWNICIRKSVK
ncbi:MAG: signal peptidase II [Candidatus Omnitrophica bacterium]|jgi:signal peptidase II|nr:signal peptidase II [Candidatus Omnitrophota bacterium]